MTNKFELTVLAMTEENQEELIEDITDLVEKYGEVAKFENDGEKRLAYDIKGQSRACYYFWVIDNLKATERSQITRALDSDERILRYLLIKSNKRS